MCVVCNIVDKDYVETALAVESTVSEETMTIPVNVSMATNNDFICF